MAHCLAKAIENELRALPGNNICVDCDGKSPQWASVSLGIFMCLECSGRHRSLGVHVSFVRSVSMDSWSEKQIKQMRMGGNDKCNSFLAKYGVAKETPIANKYNSPAAQLYRDRLLAEVEGRPLPTELPKSVNTATAGGTDPLPGESEEEYVARQRRLQAEARERLKAKFGASSGLSSGGKSAMTGIGSDSSYKPGGGGIGGGGGGGGVQGMLGGIKTEEVTAQLAEASQKAVSWLSTGIAVIGERVGKATEELRKPAAPPKSTFLSQDSYGRQGEDDDRSMGFHDNSNIKVQPRKNVAADSDVGGNARPPPAPSSSSSSSFSAPATSASASGPAGGAKGWSILTSSAAELWAKAAEATNEIIKNVVEEDDYRFPRPAEPGSASTSTSSGSGGGGGVGVGGNGNGNGIGNRSNNSNNSGSGAPQATGRTLPPPQRQSVPVGSLGSDDEGDRDQRDKDRKKALGLSLGGLAGSGQKSKKEPLASAIYTEDEEDDGESPDSSYAFLFTRCISSAFSESYLTFFPPRHDRPPVPNTPQEGAPSPSPGPLHYPAAPGSRADFSGRRFHVVSRLRRKREQCVWQGQGQGQGQKGEAGPSR